MANQPLFGPQVASKTALSPQDLVRLQLAQQLLKSGTDTSPVESPWQGAARLGQALAGGYMNYRLGEDQKTREGETAATMAQALRATKSSWTDPDSGQAMPIPNAQGGMEGAMAVLAGNPSTAGQAAQMGFAQLSEQQKLANALKEYEGKAQLDQRYKPELARLTLDAERLPRLNLRQGELDQDLAMKPKIDSAVAAAVAPIDIRKATSIHAGNVATDVANAGQLAANQRAGVLSGELSAGPGGVPLIQAREQAAAAGTAAAQQPQRSMKTEGELRGEFEGNATVKDYRATVPVYNAIVDAAKRDNKASDLNIVYGLAKIMDPTSVVREGEFKMAAAAGSPAERLVGLFNEIAGGGRLTPQQRKQFVEEAGSRVTAYKAAADQVGTRFEALAKQYNVDPKNVLMDIGTTRQSDDEILRKLGLK